MARLFPNLVFLRVSNSLEWLDRIDAGPHPMSPLDVSAAARLWIASSLIRDLGSISPDASHARVLHASARTMAERAVGGLLAGWDNHDAWFATSSEEWHPPIPHWGGTVARPQPQPWSDRGSHWIDDLPAPVLTGLIDGAVSSIERRVQQQPAS